MRNLRAVAMVIGLLAAMVMSQAPVTGLVAYWPFTGSFTDVAHNLTLQQGYGTSNVTFTDDYKGTALSACDFISGALRSADSTLPMGNTARTVSMWAYRTGVTATGNPTALMSYGPNTPGAGYKIYTSTKPGTLTQWIVVTNYQDSANYVLSGKYTMAFDVNVWLYVTVTFSNSIVNFYLNGTWMKKDTLTGCNTTPEFLWIGAARGVSATTPTNNFGGKLDNPRIYNRELDSTEIKIMYSSEYMTRVAAEVCAPKIRTGTYQKGTWNISGRTTSGHPFGILVSHTGKYTMAR